ncbi:TniQ family protein [Limnobacter parvus]|uniref:TniQ family protein n=1 Tax=Limnobacter parvus TaxID=2939690 RepID=A0ABT1XDD0_9BURK|nr:TniQ family protein [Limnobacter parvus]MCR2745288.1 TniQ family protein [Limnobacter parvus]
MANHLRKNKNLLVLAPTLNELVSTYIHRLTTVNGFKDRQVMLHHIANRFGLPDNLGITPSVELIARLLNTTALDIILKHTILPFTSILPGTVGTFDLRITGEKLLLAASKHISKDLTYCKKCTDDEFDQIGWSSYKRHHQLEHISYCHIHYGQPLLRNQPSSWDVWMPHLPANEKILYKIPVRSKMEISTQMKFHSYWSELEQSTNFIDCDLMRLFLVSTARNQGFQTTPDDQGNHVFSDHILDIYGTGLFEEVYPARFKKTRGLLFDPVDGYLIYGYRSAAKITMILPIMMGLFESAETLIEEFSSFKYKLST